MQLISAINEQSIAPYIGKPVCVVLCDGSHYQGCLGGIRNGQLYLTGGAACAETLSTSAVKAKSQLSKMAAKAKISAFGYGYGYGGYGYPYGGYAWDVALISLLFLLPFFFI
jgi:hypothetical protein